MAKWLLLSVVAAAACGRPAVVPHPAAASVLLVTIDTLRADRLGCYGDTEACTPVMDALARQGALFERAYSPAPITLPAHASLMTGLVPPSHGVRGNGSFALDQAVEAAAPRPLYAETLAPRGSTSAGASSPTTTTRTRTWPARPRPYSGSRRASPVTSASRSRGWRSSSSAWSSRLPRRPHGSGAPAPDPNPPPPPFLIQPLEALQVFGLESADPRKTRDP